MTWPGRGGERPASQRELDLLRTRVDQIDVQGTRGTASTVGVLASQLQDLAANISEWKTATQLWQGRHEAQHVDEAKARADETRARVVGRRWMIGTGITVLLLLTAMLTLIFQLLGRVH